MARNIEKEIDEGLKILRKSKSGLSVAEMQELKYRNEGSLFNLICECFYIGVSVGNSLKK